MRALKIGGVIFGAVIITALGIDAADTLQGNNGTLLGQLANTETGGCPAGMVRVAAAPSITCVDAYEVSPSKDCPHTRPSNELHTQKNLADRGCVATSEPSKQPWTYINREDAQLACIKAGKRLPTNEEWQLVAAGTPDDDELCNLDSRSPRLSGESDACQSAAGVYDTVGNVWEWTHDDVFDGVYNGRNLPEEGYVAQVDKGGVATLSTSTASDLFGEDYFWSEATGAYAIMRGGFYGSDSDGGVYAVHAATPPTMSGVAIGFRCVL